MYSSNDKNHLEVVFSVVVPIFNEEDNIAELYSRLNVTLEEICRKENLNEYEYNYEIILVDDGSYDKSWLAIKELHKKDQRIKGIRFSRNFGHHVAITAGIDHACGEIVVLMDGDLQDPPEEIPKLYAKFKEGFDLVYGIRKHRNDSLMKKLNSCMFWWIINKVTSIKLPMDQTMLRMISRRMVDTLAGMRESSRFIHGMMAWTGFDTAQVEVNHAVRKKGKSKYNLIRQLRLALYAITSFSTKPLKLATFFGFLISLLSLLTGVFFIVKGVVFGYPVLGWASIIVSVFFYRRRSAFFSRCNW